MPPAYIAAAEGSATLEREGDVTPAVVNMPVVPGDRLRTERGRIEIRFPDGTGIEIGEYSAAEIITPSRVRLLAGTLDRLEPLQTNADALSTSYLPQDLQMYGATFDRYGSWRYAPSYGYVWYPMVAPDWRPYYYGYWEPVRPYGWTWIGADVWAWPTHHYGRWGIERNAWFWIPDRTFAAAWVSWSSAPGYVSWSPLGFDNRPSPRWVSLSRTHFGARGYSANRYAVDLRQQPREMAPPPSRGPAVAVPRSGAPTRSAPAMRSETPETVQQPPTIVHERRRPTADAPRVTTSPPPATGVAVPRSEPRQSAPARSAPAQSPPPPQVAPERRAPERSAPASEGGQDRSGGTAKPRSGEGQRTTGQATERRRG